MFLTDAPPSHPATASPSSATALPQTFTGALTGAYTWLPPATLESPLVVPAPPPLFLTSAPPLQPASALPKIATALPQALIGALIGAATWLPPATLLLPEVLLPPPLFLTSAPPLQPASAVPKIATALPHALIGALIGAVTWLPPPTEFWPDVCCPPPPPPLVTLAPP